MNTIDIMQLHAMGAFLGYPHLPDRTIASFSKDTRTLPAQSVYIALSGAQYDGHDFMMEAQEKGAIAIICERPHPEVTIPQCVVPSALHALSTLAAWHRQQCPAITIAVTGSNGKTTVKEMIAHILPEPSYATPGNFNNHIGTPLALLGLRPEHRYAVFELGASAPGDIAHTVALVKPHIALINNIAPAHIAGFGTLEGVARAKGEIYQGLGKNGIAIVNADSPFAHFWNDILHDKTVYRFSRTHTADIYAENIQTTPAGETTCTMVFQGTAMPVHIKAPGIHQINNALAAAAAAFAAGISLDTIAQGLSCFSGIPGRLQYLHGKNNARIINDTYNANLESVRAALQVLARHQGRRILVLGDLAELGAQEQSCHEAIGREARALGVDTVLTTGKHSRHTSLAFGTTGKHYAEYADLLSDLLPQLDDNTTVLVKGSRSAGMERVVADIIVPHA